MNHYAMLPASALVLPGRRHQYDVAQHKSDGEKAEEASGIPTEIITPAIEDGAEQNIADPGVQHHREPQVEPRRAARNPSHRDRRDETNAAGDEARQLALLIGIHHHRQQPAPACTQNH